MAGKPAKHLVHGEWMTIYEAAERLGVKWRSIEIWRSRHRRSDGSRGLLVEAWDYYTSANAGVQMQRLGRMPRRYCVDGEMMTVREAAERFDLRIKNLYSYMERHNCDLAEAVMRLKKARIKAVVREIVKIIG